MNVLTTNGAINIIENMTPKQCTKLYESLCGATQLPHHPSSNSKADLVQAVTRLWLTDFKNRRIFIPMILQASLFKG